MSEHVGSFGKLVREEMERFGLFSMGWDYAYDRAKKRLGLCSYREKLLTFSLPYIECNTIANMHDTVLHEIAHALIGRGEGHGLMWKNKARQIGAVPRACATDPNIVNPAGDYVFVCRCNKYYYHRSDVLGKQKRCRRCNVVGRVVLAANIANIGEYVVNREPVVVKRKPTMYELLLGACQ